MIANPQQSKASPQVDQDETVHITHIRLIDSMINGILNILGD